MIRPRPYQSAAHAATTSLWASGQRMVLDVLATGLGKTYLAAMLARSRRHLGRTLFVCHREELVWQAVEAFEQVMGARPAVEMARFDANADLFAGRAPVVVATAQTLYSGAGGAGRMTRFDPREFATIIPDEAHHYVAPAFRRVLDYFLAGNPALAGAGITATPDRADRLAMGRLFGAVAYDYGIRPAIDDGWLVPVDQWTGTLTELDLSGVRTVAGDFKAEELASVMERHGNVFGVADKTLERVGDRRTLVFASGVRHGQLLTAIFNDRESGRAAFVCDKTPRDERRDILAKFAAGQLRMLVNVGIATEGFNDPGVECVVIARPTQSRCLYTQMCGRGTRVLPGVVDPYELAEDRRVAIAESAKPCVELIDWAGNAGRHKLVTAADILAGDYDSEVVARVKARATDAADAVNVTDALAEEWASLRAEREARQRAEDERLARVRVRAQATFEFVDPFDRAKGGDPKRRGPCPRRDPRRPTDRMLRFLDGRLPRGVELDQLTMGEAGKWINEINRRREAGLCTVKQAAILRDRGLPDDVPIERARQWLDRIAANRWRVPDDVRAQAARQQRKEAA